MNRSLIGIVLFLAFIPHPAHGAGMRAKEPWFREGKVRCPSYLNASQESIEFVSRVRAMGFNSALVMVGGAPPGRDHAGRGCSGQKPALRRLCHRSPGRSPAAGECSEVTVITGPLTKGQRS